MRRGARWEELDVDCQNSVAGPAWALMEMYPSAVSVEGGRWKVMKRGDAQEKCQTSSGIPKVP